MTNKLSDYDLIRGDWVKFADYGWGEFRNYAENDNNPNFHARFYDHGRMAEDDKVEAVIRPPFIFRDLLKKNIDSDTFCNAYSIPIVNMRTGLHFDMEFKNIHPKEEKKSLEKKLQEAYSSPCMPIADVLFEMAAEIDKLKNKENEG